jgi:uncharacterized protein (DUF1015 family)
VNVRPFRAYRYAGAEHDLDRIVAPPYDQVSPELRGRLAALSPANFIHFSLPEAAGGSDRYEQARRILEGWLADGTWARDPAPAVYPYAQTYQAGGEAVTRAGVIALGEVVEYGRGGVLPHERTHAGPRRDRLRLLEATGADTGLLFMLAPDPTGALRRLAAPADEPIAEARDLRGELHRLWRVTDPVAIARVRKALADVPVIIADGHHRYETAVEFARREPAARFKLMAFVPLEGPGLTILPNHRLIHDVEGFALARFLADARRWFEVTPLADPAGFQPAPRRIGVVAGDGAAVLALRDGAFESLPWPAGTSAAWRALAVSILHEGLLSPLAGITDARLDAGTHVDYTADQREAVRAAREGRCQAAFLIAPTTPAELQAVVRGGELLPQKSTHFYPKLLDGLVFARLGED